MFGKNRIDPGTVSLQHRQHATVSRFGHVADHDQRITAKPPKVAVGDIPVAITFFDPVVRRRKKFDRVDPSTAFAIEAYAVAWAQPNRDRANVLAVIASVDPVVYLFAKREGDGARFL
jgi:hypothetical protein